MLRKVSTVAIIFALIVTVVGAIQLKQVATCVVLKSPSEMSWGGEYISHFKPDGAFVADNHHDRFRNDHFVQVFGLCDETSARAAVSTLKLNTFNGTGSYLNQDAAKFVPADFLQLPSFTDKDIEFKGDIQLPNKRPVQIEGVYSKRTRQFFVKIMSK
jgi:hypothetical protein